MPSFQQAFRFSPFYNWAYPVDCQVDDWKAWGECSVTCDGGTKTRAREVAEVPLNGGAMCPALEETMVCNTEGCPGSLFPSGFLIFIITSLLNVDLQLTARLAIGSRGTNAVRLATMEPRRDQGRLCKNP